MAMKKKKEEIVDYRECVRLLKEKGPQRLYILRGEEEYLRDSFLAKLRGGCVPEGKESFNYHRLNGPKLDLNELSAAAEAMPFLGERTFCEIHDFDINKTSDYDPEAFRKILADVPDWCTIAFVFSAEYSMDGRIAPVKELNQYALDVNFTRQSDADLAKWVSNHFSELGKTIDRKTADHMVYVCGAFMNTLLPEIAKVAGAAKGGSITEQDIDAVAKRAPETTVFNLTDALGDRNYDRAALLLTDLLSDRDETPPKLLYMISEQMRRLYAARLALDSGRGREYIAECFPEIARQEFVQKKLLQGARNFGCARLGRAMRLCADCELAMKSGGGPEEELLKDLLLQLAMDTDDDTD